MTDKPDLSLGMKTTRLVWLITLLGMGAGICMLAIIYITLSRVHDERIRINDAKLEMSRLVTSLDSHISEGRSNIDKLLSEKITVVPDDSWINALSDLIRDYEKNITFEVTLAEDPELRKILKGLNTNLVTLRGLFKTGSSLNIRQRIFETMFPAIENNMLNALNTMRINTLRAEGKKRLKRALTAKNERDKPHKADHGAFKSHDTDLYFESGIYIIKTELSDIALLCERLSSANNIDTLNDLKDNQFKSALDRLRRGISALETTEPELGGPTLQNLNDFEKYLFGVGYRFENMHQTIVPGEGGLYMLSRERMTLREQADNLKHKNDALFEIFNSIRDRLLKHIEEVSHYYGAKAEKAIQKAWTTMILVWLISAATFFYLSVRIIRLLKTQITSMEITNVNLKKEVSERWNAEKALEQSRSDLNKAKSELEIRVMERTAELSETNRQLESEITNRKLAQEELTRQSDELVKALDAADKARNIAEMERDRSEKMLKQMTESQRRLEILISDATAREKRMVELKREVNDLLTRAGNAKKYDTPDKVKEFLNGNTSN